MVRAQSRRAGARWAATLIAVVTALAVVPGGPAAAQPRNASKVSSEFVCSRHPKQGEATCQAVRRTDLPVRKRGEVTQTSIPNGFGPADLQSAYHIPTAPVATAAPTVAIVDAYDDPNAEGDLKVYRAQYGLPACTSDTGCFRKVSQTGSATSLPRADSGWGTEISLDLDMVSAACGACKILLVEARSANFSDLQAAAKYAATQPGVTAVSNSYGGSEWSSESGSDGYYAPPPGVAMVASSGDDGYGVEYPAASPNVIAVGGTSLTRASNARGWSESVWNNNSGAPGSGCSQFEPKPAWQKDSGCAKRTVADVSAVADPSTGVAVYDTYGTGGWQVFGGTSVASPLIATMYGMGNATNPSGGSLVQTTYDAVAKNSGLGINDVTTGSNGSCGGSYLCQAVAGYDGPTGNGTPWGLAALGGPPSTSTTAPFTINANPSAVTVAPGGNATITLTPAVVSGAQPENVNVNVTGLPTGVTAPATSFRSLSTSGSTATLQLNVGTNTAYGAYPIQITATDASTPQNTASTTVTLTVPNPCNSAQQLANPGFESGNTAWTGTSGVIGNYSSNGGPHSGSYDAWFDGYSSAHTDTLTQTVAVPGTTCSKVTLSYWVHILTSQRTTTSKLDTFTVALGPTTIPPQPKAPTYTTVASYSNLDHNSGWVQVTLPPITLSSVLAAGQTNLQLLFTGIQSSSTNTSFLLDDVSMTFS